MSQSTIVRSRRLGRFLGLDTIDWFVLLGGIVLIGVLALLV